MRGVTNRLQQQPSSTVNGLSPDAVESLVVKEAADILGEASMHRLKAVELANTLRARVGTEMLTAVRSNFGGLLTLLSKHQHIFRVRRIPKSDTVALVNPPAPRLASSQQDLNVTSTQATSEHARTHSL